VRDTRRPPLLRPGSLTDWGGSRRDPPRSPASNIVIGGSGILARGWHQRPWAPSSLSSDFLFLLPFLCLPRELRALALPGAPLLPLPSGAPPLPRHPGATGGRHFPPLPLREKGNGLFTPSPLQGKLPSDQGKSRTATPLIREATTRRCRAGFRRRSQFFP
jgi:hypothetical protein